MTNKERLDLIITNWENDHINTCDIDWLIDQAGKQVTKEITKTIPGGGRCPTCDVQLIGKANYCGKCGQRIGWKIYDEEEGNAHA